MRVYHFMTKDYAVENVKKSRLKIATLNDMNDPYEFYLNFLGATEEDIVKFKNHYNTRTHFICFSRKLGNPVQWAHYADNHRGICMEFEIPKKYLLKVKYRKSPMAISVQNANWEKNLVDATLCKYIGWRYERESRIRIDLESNGVVKEKGLHFCRFHSEFNPVKIYTGVRCELSDKESELFVDKGLPIIKMAQDAKSYSIVQV